MAITFTKVKLPHGHYSNMSGHAVVDEAGVEWRTAEHWFQAARFADPELREAIRSHKSPMVAKFFAKKHLVSMVVVPQSEQDLANMLKVLRMKIANNPEIAAALLATGDEPIIEDVTKRPHGSGKFWGAAMVDGKWEGQNVLGEMWMKLRAELRSLKPGVEVLYEGARFTIEREYECGGVFFIGNTETFADMVPAHHLERVS